MEVRIYKWYYLKLKILWLQKKKRKAESRNKIQKWKKTFANVHLHNRNWYVKNLKLNDKSKQNKTTQIKKKKQI